MSRVVKILLVSLAGLWTVEALGHLDLPLGLVSGAGFIASTGDFLALALADAHIALPLAVVTLLVTASTRSATRVLSAALTGLTAYHLATAAWTLSAWTAVPTAVAFAVVVGATIGRLLPRDPHALFWASAPSLGLAFLGTGLSELLQSAPRAAAFHGLALLGLLLLVRGATRIGALGWIPSLAALLLAAHASLSPAARPPERAASSPGPGRPDIVLVVLDTVRADRLRAYGHFRDTMPALEAWARDALTARRAVAAAGWTAPSHASIFSGLTVSRHGIHYAATTGDGAWLRTRAVEGVEWLPAVLARDGYHCLAVTANEFAVPREARGFHRVVSPTPPRWSSRTVGGRLDRAIGMLFRMGERLRWRMPYVEAGDIVAEAIRATPAGPGPVFLFVNVMDAHSPYNPPRSALARLGVSPARLFDRYTTHRTLTTTWNDLPPGSAETLMDLYDGELRWLDVQLERLWTWIDRRFPGALVVVTSDHGEELGEEGRVGHEYGLSQRLLHVPLFVRHPELPAGELETPVGLSNLYDLIRGTAAGALPHPDVLTDTAGDALLSERYPSRVNAESLGASHLRFWISVIEGNTKVVGPSTYGLEVYDLGQEGFDAEVAVAATGSGEHLRERVDRYFEESRDRRQETPTAEPGTADEIERLRSLGYVD